MDIVPLKTVEPVEQVIQLLKRALERAKTGEIRAACLVLVPQGEGVEIHRDRDRHDEPLIFKMVTGAAYLQQELLDDLKNGSRPAGANP